jgi:hypothetical protein
MAKRWSSARLISGKATAFGRYEHTRPAGLGVRSVFSPDGSSYSFTIEAFMDTWATQQGFSEEEVIAAIRGSTCENGDSRFRLEDGRATVRQSRRKRRKVGSSGPAAIGDDDAFYWQHQWTWARPSEEKALIGKAIHGWLDDILHGAAEVDGEFAVDGCAIMLQAGWASVEDLVWILGTQRQRDFGMFTALEFQNLVKETDVAGCFVFENLMVRSSKTRNQFFIGWGSSSSGSGVRR